MLLLRHIMNYNAQNMNPFEDLSQNASGIKAMAVNVLGIIGNIPVINGQSGLLDYKWREKQDGYSILAQSKPE
jgi:hypothetical protein